MLRLTTLYPSLANPPYRLLWLGMAPALFAFNMGVVATGYAAVTLASSAFEVGLVGGAWGLPVLVVPLLGGVAADRFSRRAILVVSHVGIAAASLVIGILAGLGTLAIPHLVGLGLVQGLAFSFLTPARVAYAASVLETELMPNAIAAHYVSLNVCAMLGPAAAGMLLASPSVGLPGTYGVIVVLLALTVAAFLLLPDHRADSAEAGSAWARMREGVRYIGETRPLPALIGLAALVMLFGMPYQQLLPVFAERVFAAGAEGLGWLVACVGVGAVLGSIVTAPLRSRAGLARYQLVFGLAFGLALVGFGYAPAFGFALVGAAFAGFAASALTVVNNSLVISRSDPRFYGRVWSINQLTFGLGLLGAVPMAWLADRIGPSGAVALGGVLVAAATVGVARYAGAHLDPG